MLLVRRIDGDGGEIVNDGDDGQGDSARLPASFCVLEQRTWQLVQLLYTERTNPPSSSSSSSGFAYTPPLTLVQDAIAGDVHLSELSLVRDWLHTTAYDQLHPAEVRKGYLTYTKNKLKQAIRTTGSSSSSANLVDSLDPDAVNRTEAAATANNNRNRRTLDMEDANYEKALLRTLFEYVRVGELDQAIDMCRQSDSSWRAASLSGGKLYSDDALARASRRIRRNAQGAESDMAAAEDDDDEDGDPTAERRIVQGNIRRRLWKSMCRNLASADHVDPYERALYGAISGDLASVLPVCRSWEDHLWARVNALLEAEIDGILGRSGNYFQSLDTTQLQPIESGSRQQQSIPQAMQDTCNTLLKDPKLQQDAKHLFRVAQSWIILNRINDLLTSFVTRLDESADALDEP